MEFLKTARKTIIAGTDQTCKVLSKRWALLKLDKACLLKKVKFNENLHHYYIVAPALEVL